jgi:uncharacterized membrane protein
LQSETAAGASTPDTGTSPSRAPSGPEQATTPAADKRARLEAVDVLRGIVMIIMALDHVRDFFGNYAINPTNVTATTVPLFFTRWVTHLCAPTFFLLTGTGAYLALWRRSTSELARFLWTRGLWLIFLDAVVVRCLGLQFNFDYRVTVLNVLWALGWSMIALGALVRLRPMVVTIFGAVLIAGHNLLDGVQSSSFGALAPLWTMLHSPGFLLPGPEHTVLAAYALIPWIGVTAVGFGLGRVYDWTAPRRRLVLMRTGLALAAGFVLLRALNVYGDPVPWTTQATGVSTVLSFLNTNKYPPSFAFLLMTLGPALCFLALLDRGTPRLLRPALIFGKVPLFYFLGHLTLIHAAAVVVCLFRYGDAHWMFESSRLDQYPFTQPPDWAFGLPVVYLVWLLVVLAMFPLCVWFAGVKQRGRSPWLSYL